MRAFNLFMARAMFACLSLVAVCFGLGVAFLLIAIVEGSRGNEAETAEALKLSFRYLIPTALLTLASFYGAVQRIGLNMD